MKSLRALIYSVVTLISAQAAASDAAPRRLVLGCFNQLKEMTILKQLVESHAESIAQGGSPGLVLSFDLSDPHSLVVSRALEGFVSSWTTHIHGAPRRFFHFDDLPTQVFARLRSAEASAQHSLVFKRSGLKAVELMKNYAAGLRVFSMAGLADYNTEFTKPVWNAQLQTFIQNFKYPQSTDQSIVAEFVREAANFGFLILLRGRNEGKIYYPQNIPVEGRFAVRDALGGILQDLARVYFGKAEESGEKKGPADKIETPEEWIAALKKFYLSKFMKRADWDPMYTAMIAHRLYDYTVRDRDFETLPWTEMEDWLSIRSPRPQLEGQHHAPSRLNHPFPSDYHTDFDVVKGFMAYISKMGLYELFMREVLLPAAKSRRPIYAGRTETGLLASLRENRAKYQDQVLSSLQKMIDRVIQLKQAEGIVLKKSRGEKPPREKILNELLTELILKESFWKDPYFSLRVLQNQIEKRMGWEKDPYANVMHSVILAFSSFERNGRFVLRDELSPDDIASLLVEDLPLYWDFISVDVRNREPKSAKELESLLVEDMRSQERLEHYRNALRYPEKAWAQAARLAFEMRQ